MCQAVPLSQHGLELFTRKQARTQYQALREEVQTLARAQRIRFFSVQRNVASARSFKHEHNASVTIKQTSWP